MKIKNAKDKTNFKIKKTFVFISPKKKKNTKKLPFSRIDKKKINDTENLHNNEI